MNLQNGTVKLCPAARPDIQRFLPVEQAQQLLRNKGLVLILYALNRVPIILQIADHRIEALHKVLELAVPAPPPDHSHALSELLHEHVRVLLEPVPLHDPAHVTKNAQVSVNRHAHGGDNNQQKDAQPQHIQGHAPPDGIINKGQIPLYQHADLSTGNVVQKRTSVVSDRSVQRLQEQAVLRFIIHPLRAPIAFCRFAAFYEQRFLLGQLSAGAGCAVNQQNPAISSDHKIPELKICLLQIDRGSGPILTVFPGTDRGKVDRIDLLYRCTQIQVTPLRCSLFTLQIDHLRTGSNAAHHHGL